MAIRAHEKMGYVGIGFGRVMTDVDMLIMTKQGTKLIVSDYYSKGFEYPELDTKQDVTFISSSTINNENIVVFERKKKTGDSKDQDLDEKNGQALVYAYGYSFFYIFHFCNNDNNNIFPFISISLGGEPISSAVTSHGSDRMG